MTPAKLRKASGRRVATRFGGPVQQMGTEMAQLRVAVPRGRMVLTLEFPGKGWGAMSKQMGYSLWADLDGRRMVPTNYEALWLLPDAWDLMTPSNVEAAAAASGAGGGGAAGAGLKLCRGGGQIAHPTPVPRAGTAAEGRPPRAGSRCRQAAGLSRAGQARSGRGGGRGRPRPGQGCGHWRPRSVRSR